MRPEHIAELLAPYLQVGQHLTSDNLDRISMYIDILLRWNSRINLTAIRAPEEIVTRHFGESLFAARHLFASSPVGTAVPGCPDVRSSPTDQPAPAIRLADLGSGAGFPGIPIKLWAPHVAVTLIESNQKKIAFLREIVRSLRLMDIDILYGRAEKLLQNHPAAGAPPNRFDVVTLRAVERFDRILRTAARLLAAGGRLALLVGSSQIEAAHSLPETLTWEAPLAVPLSHSRVLLLGTSTAAPVSIQSVNRWNKNIT